MMKSTPKEMRREKASWRYRLNFGLTFRKDSRMYHKIRGMELSKIVSFLRERYVMHDGKEIPDRFSIEDFERYVNPESRVRLTKGNIVTCSGSRYWNFLAENDDYDVSYSLSLYYVLENGKEITKCTYSEIVKKGFIAPYL